MIILTILGNLILLVIAAVAAMFLLGPLWAWIYRIDERPEEIHFFTTRDGWTLALSRRKPAKPVKGREPVILCHGLGANRFNFDFCDKYSMARYLARNGIDAWVLELRGVGRSARRKFFTPGRWNWTFDDFVRKDAPAAVEYVKAATGAKKVHWVGHSMGGMISYGLNQLDPNGNVKSAVSIAGPATFAHQPAIKMLGRRWITLRYIRFIPVRAFAWMAIPLIGNLNLYATKVSYNIANMETRVVRQAMASLAHPITARLTSQFVGWIGGSGDVVGQDGYGYTENLDKIKTPYLFIAGAKDYLASPDAMRVAYEGVSSKDKQFMLFSREQGYSFDYGHGDLLVGKEAPQEVFPAVKDWLLKHSAK